MGVMMLLLLVCSLLDCSVSGGVVQSQSCDSLSRTITSPCGPSCAIARPRLSVSQSRSLNIVLSFIVSSKNVQAPWS